MRDGVVEQIGAPLALYDTPANAFVASFIGSPSMNLLPGIVRERAGGLAVVFPGEVVLSVPDGTAVQDGREVLFGVRPEHLQVGAGPGLPARVAVVEPTGADTHLALRSDAGDIGVVLRDRLSLQPGETVSLQPDARRCHLFDRATGERIG